MEKLVDVADLKSVGYLNREGSSSARVINQKKSIGSFFNLF
jgi:hypothetical protein